MPLSEHEQHLLEQMERALYAEDPKFASSLRGADLRSHYRRRALLAAVTFLLGIGLLMGGAISRTVPLGVLGFVVMLVSAFYAVTRWRRVAGPTDLGSFPAASAGRPARGSGRAASRGRRRGSGQGTFMQRIEARWRRRRDEQGR